MLHSEDLANRARSFILHTERSCVNLDRSAQVVYPLSVDRIQKVAVNYSHAYPIYATPNRVTNVMDGSLTRLTSLNATKTAAPPRPRLRPRGLPPALEPHGVYTATNPADAALFGRDLFGTHRVRVKPGDVRSFIATYHAVLLRDVTLGYLDYGVDVSVEIPRLPGDQLVMVPATGSSMITVGDTELESSPVHAIVPPPAASVRIESPSDTAHLIVRIDSGALCRHLSRMIGTAHTTAPAFSLSFDLTAPTASRWNAAIQILHAELFDPDSLLSQARGVGQIEEFIVSSLLLSLDSTATPLLHPVQRRQSLVITKALHYIAANLSEPISVADIAQAADTSVRTLQQQFRDELHATPSAYLMSQRLDLVRNELANRVPADGVTVSSVAYRWGFSHLGRFSAAYRRRFGELPSETLRTR